VKRGLAIDILSINISAEIYEQFNIPNLFVYRREVQWSRFELVILVHFKIKAMS